MTIAEQLRAAALGPTPPCGGAWMEEWLYDEYARHELQSWRRRDLIGNVAEYFFDLTSDERRTLMLFVACAIESEDA